MSDFTIKSMNKRCYIICFMKNEIYTVKSYFKGAQKSKPKLRLRLATFSSGCKKRGHHMVRDVT
ncbi:unnamed protein product [Ixodes persulcatus]